MRKSSRPEFVSVVLYLLILDPAPDSYLWRVAVVTEPTDYYVSFTYLRLLVMMMQYRDIDQS